MRVLVADVPAALREEAGRVDYMCDLTFGAMPMESDEALRHDYYVGRVHYAFDRDVVVEVGVFSGTIRAVLSSLRSVLLLDRFKTEGKERCDFCGLTLRTVPRRSPK